MTDAKVLLTCLKPGCPRTRKVAVDDLMPAGTVMVKQWCPWHERPGDKVDGCEYYDAAGVEL